MSRIASIVFAVAGFASLAAPARAQFVDGDLYVSGYASAIYRVEPGSWNVTLFADGSDGLNGVSASVLSPAGTLLCSNHTSSTVLEFDSAGNGAVLYDSADGLNGPFGESGLAYDANGDLYVSNFGASQILRFPAGGGSSTVFADSADGIVYPDGLAFAANGDLYVANRSSNNVLVIDPSGSASVFDTLPADPYSIVIRGNGDIYVATYTTPSVYRYPGGDVAQRVLLADFPGNLSNPAIQLSLDETKLYFTSYSTGNLIEVDADTGAQNEVIAAGGLGGALAITVIGRRHSASWENYGAGLAGTHGVPFFTSQQDPVLGTSITLDVGNSYGQPTSGLLVLGFQRATLHTGLGSDLLLIPALLVPISFSFGSDSFTGTLPNDPALLGFALDLQTVEADPGAVKGFSFTQGLELVLGF
jgi:YVTN family beta-propeller protein